MIKLVELLNELDKPENIYTPGYTPEEQDKEFLKKGYRMVGTTIDSETGKSTSSIEQIAQFDKISKNLSDMMAEIRPIAGLIVKEEDIALKQIKAKAMVAISFLGQAQKAVNNVKGLVKRVKGL